MIGIGISPMFLDGAVLNLLPEGALTFEGETDLLTFEGETDYITFEN